MGKMQLKGDDILEYRGMPGSPNTRWEGAFFLVVSHCWDQWEKNLTIEADTFPEAFFELSPHVKDWAVLLDKWVKENGGFKGKNFKKKFSGLLNAVYDAESGDKVATILGKYRPKATDIPRLNRAAIQKVDPIFEREDVENLLRLPLMDWGKPVITRYPDQGTFTAVYERQTSKTQTIYARFPEIPIEYEGKVPYLGKMLFHVLVSTLQIVMHEKSYSVAFQKSEQLELMDMKGQGAEFENLTNCHRTWYYLDIGVKDQAQPDWEYHKRVYSDFETLPGKGGYISVKLNPSAWPLLEKFFEDPKKLEKQFFKINHKLGSVKSERQQTLFELGLSQYAGLGNKFFPQSLKKVFEWIEIFYPEYQKRGMPWAVKELEKCLKCSLEKNQIIGWTYKPSEEIIKIFESDPRIRPFCRREDVEEKGPAWFSDRLKAINKDQDIVKHLKAKNVKLPRKLDPSDVYLRWKIKINLGDKRQKSLIENGQEKRKNPEQLLYDLSRKMGR